MPDRTTKITLEGLVSIIIVKRLLSVSVGLNVFRFLYSSEEEANAAGDFVYRNRNSEQLENVLFSLIEKGE